jgi:hypothetical protein
MVTSGVYEVTPENDRGKAKQVDILMQKPLNYDDIFLTSRYESREFVLVTTPLASVTDSVTSFVYTADMSLRECGFEVRRFLR